MERNRGKPAKVVGVKCKYCGGIILCKYAKRKYCSHQCYWKDKIGKRHSWGNKISEKLRGKNKSVSHIANAAEAHRGVIHPSIRGERHPNWKGVWAGYDAIHDFVKRRKEKSKSCQHCGKSSLLHLSNLSGKYERLIEDWVWLCPKCHSKMDKGKNSVKTRFPCLNK